MYIYIRIYTYVYIHTFVYMIRASRKGNFKLLHGGYCCCHRCWLLQPLEKHRLPHRIWHEIVKQHRRNPVAIV